jgi:hypothetical protein
VVEAQPESALFGGGLSPAPLIINADNNLLGPRDFIFYILYIYTCLSVVSLSKRSGRNEVGERILRGGPVTSTIPNRNAM